MYLYESLLVDDMLSIIENDDENFINVITEFNYGRGKPDIVLLTKDHEIITIEAKLKKWKNALYQATRNTCFANYSYVLLPKEIAERAMKHQEEFDDRQVGIYYIENGNLIKLHKARRVEPIQPWLNEKVTDEILGANNAKRQC